MRTQAQNLLRLFARSRDDFQSIRKRLDNRLGRKADGTAQNIDDRGFAARDVESIIRFADVARSQEVQIAKKLQNILKYFPVYEQWLSKIKGVGEVSAAWLLGEFDIQEALTVSKMWQYAGLNPGMIRGKKCIQKSKYKKKMGAKIGTKEFRGKKYVIVLTDEMIRADKATPGFILPYNKRLRTALVGVLADSFIKSQSPYATEFYYPYKHRLEQEENKIGDKAWKDVSKGHRDRAARRYMIKNFLKDFYVAWRAAENLPIRKPYNEEYLGLEHSA